MERGRGRTVKTYHGDMELNDKVAQILGIKLKNGMYKSLTEGQSTLFTAPPEFDLGTWAINYLVNFAKEKGVKIKYSNNPRVVAEEFVSKFGK